MAKNNLKLITGGSGFVGINLAKKLAELNYKVRIFDTRALATELGKNIEFYKGDIRDYSSVYKSCKDADVVFNLASLLPCSRAGDMFIKVNVGGTENVARAALERNVKKVVHLSSSIVYGVPKKSPCDENSQTEPIGDYGKSKLAAEKICQEHMKKGLKATIIRPRMIIGAGRLGLLTILFDWVKRNKKIYLIGSGNNRFQMVGVSDLVDACVLSIDKGDNEIFNIGADKTPKLNKLMDSLVKHAGSNSKIVPINAAFARYVLMALDRFKLTPLNIEHYLIADKDYVLDTRKAKRVLGWKPRHTAIELMNEAYDYYINNYEALPKESASDFPEQRLLKLIRFFS